MIDAILERGNFKVKQDSRDSSPKPSSNMLDSLCPKCQASQPSISAKHLSQASQLSISSQHLSRASQPSVSAEYLSRESLHSSKMINNAQQ